MANSLLVSSLKFGVFIEKLKFRYLSVLDRENNKFVLKPKEEIIFQDKFLFLRVRDMEIDRLGNIYMMDIYWKLIYETSSNLFVLKPLAIKDIIYPNQI